MDELDATQMRLVAEGLRFPEGPIAMDDGSVLVVEIEGGTLAHVRTDGSVHRIECGGGPNGAAIGPDGAVYVCNDGGLTFTTEDGIRFPYAVAEGNEGGSLQRVDLTTGEVRTVFTHSDGVRIGSLNDIVFDGTGSCWFVDTTNGCLHYGDPLAGTVRIAERDLAFPNGLGLSPDGRRLYVSETYSGQVLAWDVAGPGRLTGRTRLADTAGAHHFDGLAIDGAGNVCVANLQRSGITVIAPDGSVLGRMTVPLHDTYVTNICFAGEDGATAYITSAGRGRLYAVPWPWRGLRLHHAR